MKAKFVFFAAFAAIAVLWLIVGCAPGTQLAFNPEIQMNGFGGAYGTSYSPTLRYGYYYPFAEIVVTNNTPYYLQPEQDGRLKVLRDAQGQVYTTIAPGQSLRYHIAVPYYTSVPTAVVAKAFTPDGRFIGVADRKFYFYGNINQRLLESWVVNTYDVREARSR